MMKRNRVKKLMIISCLMVFLLASCSDTKKVPANEGILGTWYECIDSMVEVVIFYEDGTFMRTMEEYAKAAEQDYQTYQYDESAGTLSLQLKEYPAEVIVEEDKMIYQIKEYGESHVLYRDRESAILNDPTYLISDVFTDTIMDEEGFCIKDDVLYAYRGDAKEVTVPENVDVIYTQAFAGDYNHGVNLEKVIIPGTVKEIQGQAFAFTNAEVIVIEEGVEAIGDYAFMDSYMEELYFPASLQDIGAAILETEEGLTGTKIHVPEGSEMAKYLKDNPPYGELKIIVE